MRSLEILRAVIGGPAVSATGMASMLLGIAIAASGCAVVPGSDRNQVGMKSFAPLVQEVLPAVVNVSAIQRSRRAAADWDAGDDGAAADSADRREAAPSSSLDELLRKFFEEQGRRRSPNLPGLALGSGFIIDPRGYIVTDDHVLENADNVAVTFHDGSQHSAQIIGRDALTDLALLKIDTSRPLPYVHWGDSDAVRVGDWVLAIGNPFGLDDTVSSGIISARGRDIHSGPYDDFLQIDASINRGNSGGPTFDLDGNVIGINSAIYSPNGGSVGIGFAIPANLARPVVDQLLAHGKVARGWLGVQIQAVTPEIAGGFGLPQAQGALVAGLSPGGPAARAGFAQGDVILSINGREIERMRDLPLIVAEMPIGQAADVTVWRHDQKISLRPVIGLMPDEPKIAELQPSQDAPPAKSVPDIAAGLKLGPLTVQLRQRLQIPKEVNGVVVNAITDESPLAGADLLPGDVIEMINQQPVSSPEDVFAALKATASRGSKTILVLVNRHGTDRYLALSLAGQAPTGGPG
ncbi:MAG TPA: Do family serine endopeptidase [Stellaceae bacterium]|nr:Do family serine endopeptidase [Stellaceae bacterium]